MNKMILLFDEFIMKAVTMTESMLEADYRDNNKIENFTYYRDWETSSHSFKECVTAH